MAIDTNAPLAEIAKAIVTNNLADYHVCDLTRGWEIVLSPVWEPHDSGRSVRRACLQPRSMREHYFEGPARQLLESELGVMVAGAGLMNEGGQLDQIVAEMQALYCTPDAPFVELDTVADPGVAVISCMLADVARKARVGMTPKEIVESYRGATNDKLVTLAQLEAAVFEQARDAPVDELVKALKNVKRLRAGA